MDNHQKCLPGPMPFVGISSAIFGVHKVEQLHEIFARYHRLRMWAGLLLPLCVEGDVLVTTLLASDDAPIIHGASACRIHVRHNTRIKEASGGVSVDHLQAPKVLQECRGLLRFLGSVDQLLEEGLQCLCIGTLQSLVGVNLLQLVMAESAMLNVVHRA